MPLLADSALAFGKLCLTFACIALLLRFRVPLWLTLGAGCLALALLTGMPPELLAQLPWQTLRGQDLLIIEVMILLILILSDLQGASGQSRRMVDALTPLLRWPRVRLVLFPALVGLFPMPGGALFSCPMLDAVAQDFALSSERKALINLWFRHIWELAWPLYPGYILVSAMLGLPILTLLTYTFPLVICSFGVGWFFFMRGLKVPPVQPAPRPGRGETRAAIATVLYEALPILITMIGAGVFSFIFSALAPTLPAQCAFIASLILAVFAAWIQGRKQLTLSFAALVCKKKNLLLLLLIFVIFLFKNIITASGVVNELSHLGNNRALILALFILLPLLCGLLTGLMVGYVGACFPILLGILEQAGLQAYAFPLCVLALVSGNIGQLPTPVHVCMVVTCEYFKVGYAAILKRLLSPLGQQFFLGALWCFILYLAGANPWD